MSAKQKQMRGSAITKNTQDMRNQEDAKKDRSFYTKVIVAVVALAVAFVLCFLYGNESVRKGMTAVTVDGEKYSATELDFYYNTALNNYSGYFSYMGVDPNQDLDAQQYSEDQSWGDFLRDQAVTALQQTSAMYKVAMDEGFEIDEELQKAIDEYSASIDEYCSNNAMTRDQFLQTRYGEKMTNDIFMKHLTMTFVTTDFMAKHQKNTDYTNDELNAFYKENSKNIDRADFDVLTVNADYTGIEGTTEGSTEEVTYTEEQNQQAMDAAKAKAEKYLASVNAGEALSKVADAEGDRFFSSKTNASFADYAQNTFAEWVFDAERSNHDTGIVEDTAKGCWYVVVLNDRYRPDYATVDIRHIFFRPVDSGLTPEQDGYEEAKATNDAKAKADAESALAQFRSGETTFDALAEKADVPNGGKILMLANGSGYVTSEVDDWAFADDRKVGDSAVISTASGYALVVYDGTDVPFWQAESIHGLNAKWVDDIYAGATLKTHALGLKAVG